MSLLVLPDSPTLTPPSLVEVHLACNDYRDGSPTGKAMGLEILAHGDIALGLESFAITNGPACHIFAGKLKLARKMYPIHRHSTWVGNWCWDSVLVNLDVAAQLLNDARVSSWWSPDSGWSTMWERWDSPEPFTPAFLQNELKPVVRLQERSVSC